MEPSPLLLWEHQWWGAREGSRDVICWMTHEIRALEGMALSSLEKFTLLLLQQCSKNKLPGNKVDFGDAGKKILFMSMWHCSAAICILLSVDVHLLPSLYRYNNLLIAGKSMFPALLNASLQFIE